MRGFDSLQVYCLERSGVPVRCIKEDKNLDNFREWLSDNLRYFMLGGVILIIVAVLFFSIRACTGSGKGTSDGEQTTAQDNSQGNDPSSPEDDGETNDGKKEEDTNPLEDGSEEVTALMNSYYDIKNTGK